MAAGRNETVGIDERKAAAALSMAEAALRLMETMAVCLEEESRYHTATDAALRQARQAARQMAPLGQRAS